MSDDISVTIPSGKKRFSNDNGIAIPEGETILEALQREKIEKMNKIPVVAEMNDLDKELAAAEEKKRLRELNRKLPNNEIGPVLPKDRPALPTETAVAEVIPEVIQQPVIVPIVSKYTTVTMDEMKETQTDVIDMLSTCLEVINKADTDSLIDLASIKDFVKSNLSNWEKKLASTNTVITKDAIKNLDKTDPNYDDTLMELLMSMK